MTSCSLVKEFFSYFFTATTSWYTLWEHNSSNFRKYLLYFSDSWAEKNVREGRHRIWSGDSRSQSQTEICAPLFYNKIICSFAAYPRISPFNEIIIYVLKVGFFIPFEWGHVIQTHTNTATLNIKEIQAQWGGGGEGARIRKTICL
jgi:hypothetical protein